MCGCGRPAGEPPTRATTLAVTRKLTPRATIALKYRGRRALLIRGPATGTGYACYPDDTIRVHASDAKALMASGLFRLP